MTLAGTYQEEINQIIEYFKRYKLVLAIKRDLQDFLGGQHQETRLWNYQLDANASYISYSDRSASLLQKGEDMGHTSHFFKGIEETLRIRSSQWVI